LKKLIASILLSVFVFNFAGFSLLFFIEREIIHFQMKEKVEKFARLKTQENLQQIVLHKDEAKLYLVDDGRELCIKGEMYDIGRREYKGDEIVFHVMHDKEEGELLAALEKFLDLKDNFKKNGGQIELNLVKFLCLGTLISTPAESDKNEILITAISETTQHFSSIKLKPAILPPRQA